MLPDPDADAAGHRAGDDAALAGCEMVLRVDAGGCSARIAAACGDRYITFFMSARATAGIDAAIASARCDPLRWIAAATNPTQRRSKPHTPAPKPCSPPSTTAGHHASQLPTAPLTQRPTCRARTPMPGTPHPPSDHPRSAKQHPPGPTKPTNPPRTPKTQPKTPIRHSHEQSGLACGDG